MPKYSFICPNAHPYEAWAPFEDIWAPSPCCGVPGQRDLYTDLRSQLSVCDDPIRKAWLGSEIDRNLQAQGRALDPMAPKDRFEAKHVEKALGRIHIGDDISKLRPNAQKAILKGEHFRGRSRPVV